MKERLNGLIHVNRNILNFFAIFTEEAEVGRCFVTGRDVINLKETLEELGQPHPIIKVCTENTTAAIIAYNKIKQQKSRAMNMHYF